tara:strand:+ start:366 stop:773 length:408 start_codon:yes stop_codon:yes gene_type:complete
MSSTQILCNVTGVTFNPNAKEGFYFLETHDGATYHMCTLAHSMFGSLHKHGFRMDHLPPEAQDRFRWLYVGNPDEVLYGGGLRDRSARITDEKKRRQMSKKQQDKARQAVTNAYFTKQWDQQGIDLEAPSDTRIE